MNLWRLELLRLSRTHRWMILAGAYLMFGVLGPLTARYFTEIMERFGGGMTIVAPDPRPVDGIEQFVGNASQLGLLAVVGVAVAALAIDTRPEVAAFLRTRVARASALVIPRYVTTTVAAVCALVAGTAVAWALTTVLIGDLPTGAMVLGTALGALYLAFAVAVAAAVSGWVRSQLGGVLVVLAVLLALPVLGLLPDVAPWLPSRLLGAVVALVEGAAASEFTRAGVVTVVVTAALLFAATRLVARREL